MNKTAQFELDECVGNDKKSQYETEEESKKVESSQDNNIEEFIEHNTKDYLTETENRYVRKEEIKLSVHNNDFLTDILSQNNCPYEPELAENIIKVPEETRRRLFTDDNVEDVNQAVNIISMVVIDKPSAPNPFQNKTVYNGICFTCLNNISRSQYGVKCPNCTRTYHIKCIAKNTMKAFGMKQFMCNAGIDKLNM